MSKPELSPQGRKLVSLLLSNNICKGKENTGGKKEGVALPGVSTLVYQLENRAKSWALRHLLSVALAQTSWFSTLLFCAHKQGHLLHQ